jgi:SAM-dependent methyltransferase
LGESDFHKTFPAIEDKFNLASNKLAHAIDKLIYGRFYNNTDYLIAVDALIASTYETEHRNYILFSNVLPKIKYTNNFLDIGVGNGDLTKFFGQYFSRISVVDTKAESLSNVPDFLGSNNAAVLKIEDSILNHPPAIFNEKYDLILLSHVLYYYQMRKDYSL